MILDGVSLYNLGYTRSEVCQLIKEKYGPEIKPSTLTNWIRELAPLINAIQKATRNNSGTLSEVKEVFPDTISFWIEAYFRLEVTTSQSSQKVR